MPNVGRPDAADVYLSRQVGGEEREIAQKINGGLSLGKAVHAERTGNIDGQWLRITLNLPANTATKVYHGLGRVPVYFDYMTIEKAASIYAVDMGSWTDSVMYVASDARVFDAVLRII